MGKDNLKQFRADLAHAMNVRANLAYTLAGKSNTIAELDRLANWVLNGMAVQKSINDEIERANKELDAKLKSRAFRKPIEAVEAAKKSVVIEREGLVKRKYTKKPGVKYGRASWSTKSKRTHKVK